MNRRSIVAAALWAGLFTSHAHPQCTPDWSGQFSLCGDVEARIFTSISFDADGAGPGPTELYLAGKFESIGGVKAPSIARWDGTRFHALGTSGLFMNSSNSGVIYSLAVYQGQLYAAGRFDRLGAIDTVPTASQRYYVARFNGTTWEKVGRGLRPDTDTSNLSPRAYELAVFDDGSGEKLWLVGSVQYATNASNQRIYVEGVATWDGLTWDRPGSPMPAVFTIGVFDPDGSGPGAAKLLVGGKDGLFERSGTFWSPLVGGDAIGGVSNFTSFDADGAGPNPPVLYAVTGQSYYTYGTPINGAGGQLSRWDGAAWSQVDLGLNAGELVWRAFGASFPTGPRLCVTAYHPGSLPLAHGAFFTFDGTGVQDLGGERVNGRVDHFAQPTAPGVNGVLLTGDFFEFGSSPVYRLATFDGVTRNKLFGGDGIYVNAGDAPFKNGSVVLDADGSGPGRAALYVAGSSFTAPFTGNGLFGTGLGRVGKWDGREWSAAGSTWPVGSPQTIHVFDTPAGPKLYTFGSIIARLDGDTWIEVAAPEGNLKDGKSGDLVGVDHDGNPATPDEIYRLQLYLGGEPPTAPAVQKLVNGAFVDVPVPGDSYWKYDLAAFDEDGAGPGGEHLYLGQLYAVYRRDSAGSWTAVGTMSSSSPTNTPLADSLLPFSDASGSWLLVGGNFSAIDGVPAVNAAKWDGAAWSQAGNGLASLWPSGSGCSRPYLRVVDLGSGIPGLGAGKKVVAGPIFNTSVCTRAAYLAVLNGLVGDAGSTWGAFNQTWGAASDPCGFQDGSLNIPQHCAAQIPLHTAVLDDGAGPALYVIGGFINVAGTPSDGIARFGCPLPQPCAADFNNSGGQPTVQDIFDYLTAYFSNSAQADFNDSGAISVQDIFDFLTAYFSGC